MLNAGVKSVNGRDGKWWTLDIDTDLQMTLDNTTRGDGGENACGGIGISIFRPTPKQLRDIAVVLQHGAYQMEKETS